MKNTCRIRISADDEDRLHRHMFRDDGDEHGAVLLAGVAETEGGIYLSVREVHLAEDGVDYLPGKFGHRALTAQFVYRNITRARDEGLAYLAVHNHTSDLTVGFSRIDRESHERGYPALLQVGRGVPVGAVVFGHRAADADVWMPDGRRLTLSKLTAVGSAIRELTPRPVPIPQEFDEEDRDRQIRMFGQLGQLRLRDCKVAVAGLGGVGSLVCEYLAHLGVGRFVIIDDDTVEHSNLSRIVGSSRGDAVAASTKASVAARLILQANPGASIEVVIDDVVKGSVARRLIDCDYLFIAADSMRARLVMNAVVHQYLIPAAQIGAKIRSDEEGGLLDVMATNRQVRPGRGCLWCNSYIDPTQLAVEGKTDQERKNQAYGTMEPNPSVITLNAVAAAHAANDFMMDYLALRAGRDPMHEHFHFLKGKRMLVQPRRDGLCGECSENGKRYARGDGFPLPCAEG